MEGSGVGIGRIDCYEDMFKEITRKLYGEDPDHRSKKIIRSWDTLRAEYIASSIQNEFETSASYKNNTDDDTGNGNDGTDDAGWTCAEEPLECTEGSRVAAYHATKATWRCCECGECLGGGPREVAEHFLGLHPSRVSVEDGGVGHHAGRSTECRKDSLADEVTLYLERVRERAERPSPPSRRSQETQTIPAALLPPATSFLLHDVHAATSTQHAHLHQQSPGTGTTTTASGKRYACPYCPYGTDRRDLYTRHENIHREEKPFHCYVCYKPFNRADHVKKHFLRMHREHRYELARIRRPTGSTSKSLQDQSAAAGSGGTASTGSHHTGNYPTAYNNKSYQLHSTSTTGLYPTPGMPATTMHTPARRTQNGGCNSKSHLKGASKGAQERRYTCCYCSWSGVDNWCLKRHLNTHLKPFACALCEYKAARAERLSTHVLKVHNRRQCSRCSYLAEDAAQLQLHQLHVHRVTTANAPTAPPTPRHHQHLQPSGGGGRPPPGPPVFPAPAPPTVSGSVIPPTTILGHEMVDGSTAAASLQSQDILICENCGSEFLKRTGFGTRHEGTVSRRCSENQPIYCYKCSIYQLDVGTCSEMIDRITRSYLASYENQIKTENRNRPDDDISCTSEKRARKQRRPQKLPAENDVQSRQNTFTAINIRGTQSSTNQTKIIEIRERCLAQLVSRKGLLKCYRCSRHASARAFMWVPYHTKASLILHNLWRHSRPNISLRTKRESRSVTLRATVYTRHADAFQEIS
ncbi:protein charlatan isoform X1 [Neodiprion lecontei]|uniref:Protein charlatan isoform X1 n=1 Tax=Neodiprion lecontei TaxID=441921 RepID=A0A6J0BIA7_NEOLC|nr:protein charlatan isoform X1 [Neodiprion lecontei]XP_046602743.1 protein charlatan isoform X1 [Neodiprion lecontei]XP_046602753.1 protein charlatan isoform X1 [Neodiprion lecontei]XP_046602758.1 protein charlatan isoform X1 [Neodiprion lecontei]XP_046602762.1 protein charlatan isoform X1 [Neodiprion lecontei]XP_046602769.1 protein charlatan isoform X1 [Neodiprion lecontei]